MEKLEEKIKSHLWDIESVDGGGWPEGRLVDSSVESTAKELANEIQSIAVTFHKWAYQ